MQEPVITLRHPLIEGEIKIYDYLRAESPEEGYSEVRGLEIAERGTEAGPDFIPYTMEIMRDPGAYPLCGLFRAGQKYRWLH